MLEDPTTAEARRARETLKDNGTVSWSRSKRGNKFHHGISSDPPLAFVRKHRTATLAIILSDFVNYFYLEIRKLIFSFWEVNLSPHLENTKGVRQQDCSSQENNSTTCHVLLFCYNVLPSDSWVININFRERLMSTVCDRSGTTLATRHLKHGVQRCNWACYCADLNFWCRLLFCEMCQLALS